MATIQEKLEALFDKVRALPEDSQRLAVLALSEITEQAGTYILSDEERAVLEPALREAEAGEGLSDAETDELLAKPWR